MVDLSLWLQRLDLVSVLDILLVALALFALLTFLRGTRAIQLVRGILVVVVVVGILGVALPLTAFGWLVRNTLPGLLFAIPVIFAPELRRALEKLGHAPTFLNASLWEDPNLVAIGALTQAAQRLAEKRHGALIVIERETGLQDYIDSGVPIDARITPELLMTIFFKPTPLHDGAVIVRNGRIAAAGCVLPLSLGGILADRQMGLRHRAALGVSEVSDAVVVLVSEQSGQISVAHNGRMIRRLDAARLETILRAFHPTKRRGLGRWLGQLTRLRRGRPAPAAAPVPRPLLPRRESEGVEFEEGLRQQQ